MSGLRERIVEFLDGELDEHGYEDDDEKRAQVADHFADRLLDILGLRVDTENIAVFVPVLDEDGNQIMDNRYLFGKPVTELHFIEHTRAASVWESLKCPECNAERGVHDRRHAEYIEAARQLSETFAVPE